MNLNEPIINFFSPIINFYALILCVLLGSAPRTSPKLREIVLWAVSPAL